MSPRYSIALVVVFWACVCHGRRMQSSTKSSRIHFAEHPNSLGLVHSYDPIRTHQLAPFRQLLLALGIAVPLGHGTRIVVANPSVSMHTDRVAHILPLRDVKMQTAPTPVRGQAGYKRAKLKRYLRKLSRRGDLNAEDTVAADFNDAALNNSLSDNATVAGRLDLETASGPLESVAGNHPIAANVVKIGKDGAEKPSLNENATVEARLDLETPSVPSESVAGNHPIAANVDKIGKDGSGKPALNENATVEARLDLETPSVPSKSVAGNHPIAVNGDETGKDAAGKPCTAVSPNGERIFLLPKPGRLDAEFPPSPCLTPEEEQQLRNGERVFWQLPPGKGRIRGAGFAVIELHANADDVWRSVRDFDRYSDSIKTVRKATRYDDLPNDLLENSPLPKNSRLRYYRFSVSRLNLPLDVGFFVDDEKRYAAWQLHRRSWVLSDSTGYWRVEPCEGRTGVVRVWFVVGVQLAGPLPSFVIGLVARFGLDKATRWLKNLEAPAT